MHDPCIPETLFHADDRIISSISLNQGDMSVRKQTHHRYPVLLLLLSSLSFSHILPLSFSRFHYVSHSLSQSPFSLSPTLPLSFRVVEKWRIDWMSVSLWEMSLLMWRTGLVPYSSASLWITVRLQRLPCARRHICFLSKSQTERKMSGEYKSISCLFQVFISPSLGFSLSLMIFLLRASAPSPLSPAVKHILRLFSATIVLSPSLSPFLF